MDHNQQRPCPECNSKMQQIRIIDKTHGSAHADFEYTDDKAKRDFFFARYPVKGRILAYMCENCGRILFYGFPTKD